MSGAVNGDRPVAVLIAEIERWNRQINLVSRVDTQTTVNDLVAQCREAWQNVLLALGDEPWLDGATYFDLGSGAGLPGLVWAAERMRARHCGFTVLVEPRDKRAWFLKRTARMMGLDPVDVVAERWGEGEGLRIPAAPGAVVSMKALHLVDDEVLSGLVRLTDPGARPESVAIMRFLEPGNPDLEQLESKYVAADPAWARDRVEVLGEGQPRLLLTMYRSR